MLVAIAAASDSVAQPACTVTWDGGAGSNAWHEAANWTGDTGDTLPGPTDNVCIPTSVTVVFSQATVSVLSVQSQGTLAISGGTLNLTDTTEGSTTANLTQTGGILGGAGTLTVSGAFDWSGGTHADAGTTVIASGGTLSVVGGFVVLGSGRTLQVDFGATATMDADARIFMDDNARIENAGTFNANGDDLSGGGIFFSTGGLVHNTGTFRRSGTGAFPVTVPFDNDGTVEASAGTLSLQAGDAGATTGSFNGSGIGGLVSFASQTFTLATGASLSGRIELTGATLNVSANVSHTAGGTFTQTGGILGGAGTLTVSGAFDWSGGTHADAGTTVIASGGTLSVVGGFVVLGSGRTLQVDFGATATMDADARIFMDDNARIENAGTFNANGDDLSGGGIFFSTGGLVHNTGTFRRSGTGAFPVTVPFDNDGTVEVAAGILSVASYTQSPSGTLLVHVGGLTPGTGFTQLNVAGAATLDGTLRITTESGFQPTLGQSFRIVNANPRSGTFSSIEGADIGGGLSYTVQYDTTGATLVVGPSAFPQVSINDVSVTEGNSGTTDASFTVALSSAAVEDVTVGFATADGSASAPGDYTAHTGTLTIPAGQTSGQITVVVQGDTSDEPDETFLVNLSNPSANATISDSQATGTILDDDAQVVLPTLTINDVSVTEGNSGTTDASFTVALSSAAVEDVTVGFATADGSASAPGDYTAHTGTLTIPAGQTSGQITVVVQGDTSDEPDETFLVNLSNPSANATISDSQATGTILDDDAQVVLPTLTINDVSVTEGNSGTTDASFTVALSSAAVEDVTVGFATADGSASAPGDYTAHTGTLTIPAGQTSGQITVVVQGDTSDEPDETFLVNLSNPSANATISDSQATGTILDDDAQVVLPTLTINDVSVTEGNSGTTDASFTVALSSAAVEDVTVGFATADGSASAPGDYTAHTGTLTIPAGQTSGQITVVVQGDTTDEPDETFLVNLSNPSANATISDSQATGTILDDDAQVVLPTLTINDVSVTEGNSGTTDASFTVALSSAAVEDVTVGFATADGSASAPGDYTAHTGTLTIPAGQTSGQITVVVQGDTTDEPDETFLVNLSNPSANATISDSQATGTILDDDAQVVLPTLTINDVSVTEGNSGTTDASFTVALSSAAVEDVTVGFATADGSASAPGDYTAHTGTLTIPAGQTSGQITVVVQGDTTDEPDETFLVNLSNPSANATISDSQATGTILDDDAQVVLPTLTINDVSVTEGNSGTTDASFTVALSSAAVEDVTVGFATADGSASAPGDYTAHTGTLTIPAGQTSGQITVVVQGDTSDEPDETFLVNLSNPSANATISDSQATGTIVDDDVSLPATLTLSPASATNRVGEQHCVTATVPDGSGNPVPGVSVRFSVTGANSGDGSRTTDANGEATFCYAGANAGHDTIKAFADTDGDRTQGTGEPNGEATKNWVEAPTVGVPCEIEGVGKIEASNGDKATFSVDLKSGAPPKGMVRYTDRGPAELFKLKSTEITDVVISAEGREANILGKATLDGAGPVDFRVDVKDLAGASDTFRIRLSSGYDSGEQTIRDGDVEVECKCNVEGDGRIRTANGDSATFRSQVKAIPPTGKLRFEDRGPEEPFKLKSTEITDVSISADEREASIRGKAKIKGADSVDFRIDVRDPRRKPDTFRIRLSSGYDSGEQTIRDGDIDIECGGDNGDDNRHRDHRGHKRD